MKAEGKPLDLDEMALDGRMKIKYTVNYINRKREHEKYEALYFLDRDYPEVRGLIKLHNKGSLSFNDGYVTIEWERTVR